MKRPAGYFLLLLLAGCGLAPASAPVSEPEPETPVRVKLLFTGDVMQHLPQVEAARRAEGFDYSECFAAVRPRFQAADLTVVNLETTLTCSS